MPYADPDQRREYQRKWIAGRRTAWFDGKVCAWCGSTNDLQLDHENPAMKIDHRVWSWSAPRREAELAKCRPLCSPCHQLKSMPERARGERIASAKLNEADVRAILASPVTPYRLIAEQYGVDSSLIGYIKRRKVWKHLGG